MPKDIDNVSIFSYKMASHGAIALGKELKIKQILHAGSHYKGNSNKVVINWGATQIPANVTRSYVLNSARAVELCSNKLRFFRHLEDIKSSVPTPEWTTKPSDARAWLENRNIALVARMKLSGHSGDGIKILKKGVDFVIAPLYTVYVPKQYEYRVHVMDETVIDVQRKVMKRDAEASKEQMQVRSHNNGWIFTRDPELVKLPNEQIKTQAIQCVKDLGLEFAAVDIIYSVKRQQSYVLEANSAPGLEGESIKIYGKAFRNWLNI